MPTRAIRIRDPRPADEPAWRRLWAGRFLRSRRQRGSDVRDLAAALSAGIERVRACRRLAGYGRGLYRLRTALRLMEPHPACYLEDLFVDPSVRGHGLGRALIEDLLHTAGKRRWSPVYWHTRQSNELARNLYDKFTEADDFVRYRIFLPPVQKRKRQRTAAGASRRV